MSSRLIGKRGLRPNPRMQLSGVERPGPRPRCCLRVVVNGPENSEPRAFRPQLMRRVVRPHPNTLTPRAANVGSSLPPPAGHRVRCTAILVVANSAAFRLLGNPHILHETGVVLAVVSQPCPLVSVAVLDRLPHYWGQVGVVWVGLAINATLLALGLQWLRRRVSRPRAA